MPAEHAESFGYKTAWFAAKGVTAQAFAAALAARNLQTCAWSRGLADACEDANERRVFITPPIDEWVLIVGQPLLALADGPSPRCAALAAELAAQLQTEVQYFASHRVVEAHAWVRAGAAGIRRAFLWLGESGEKLLDIGQQTAEERALGFAFFDPESGEAEADGYWERKDLTYAGEEHVMQLASRWSVNPSRLSERSLGVGAGWLAELSPSPPTSSQAPSRRPWWKPW